MLLRTRISFFVTIAFAIVCISILFATNKREELAQIEYAKATIFDQQNLWDKVKGELIQRMTDGKALVEANVPFINALESGDSESIRTFGIEIAAKIMQGGIADRFDAIFSDGTIAYSSHPAIFQSSVIREGVAMDAIEFDYEISGVGNDRDRNTAVVLAFPLITESGKAAGMGVYAIDIVEAIEEMENLTQASVSVVNRRGRLLAASDGAPWQTYGDQVRLIDIGVLQNFEFEERFFSAVVLPEISNLGGLVGRLVIIKDVTGLALQQKRISQITIVSIVIFVLAVLIGLNVYMSRAFSPLAKGVKVLNALSEGDLNVQIEHVFSRDEVGTIVDAVDRFRSSLLTLVRLRRSRERQRSRQERFIQREMTSLAGTLDGEEREAVIDELQRLDQIIQKGSKIRREITSLAQESESDGAARDSDGLALMATAFQSMSSRIQNQHQKLREAIATREALIALRQELDIATRVQLSLLPEPFNVSETVDLAGSMFAAKEVGGDFFDYFRLDERRIGIAVADVSGKGVAAALFMAMARTLLRGTVLYVDSPAKVLETMNDFLEENNDEQLFLTMLYGVLDESTGVFTYASAGHDAPVHYRDGQVDVLESENEFVLAMFPSLDYSEIQFQLKPGSRMTFFTDGITEAFNSTGEPYRLERLVELASKLDNESAQKDVDEIVAQVNRHVGGADQFDDITCVVLNFKRTSEQTVEQADDDKESAVLEITLESDLKELGRIADLIEQHSEARNWPSNWAYSLNLVLDELITNVVSYGYGKGYPVDDIHVVLTEQNDQLTVVLEDKSAPYNPFEQAPEAQVDLSLDERKVGGLGVFFVKSLVSDYKYERLGNRNQITLVFSATQ